MSIAGKLEDPMWHWPDLTEPRVDPAAEIRIMRLLIAKHPDEAKLALAELNGADKGEPDLQARS